MELLLLEMHRAARTRSELQGPDRSCKDQIGAARSRSELQGPDRSFKVQIGASRSRSELQGAEWEELQGGAAGRSCGEELLGGAAGRSCREELLGGAAGSCCCNWLIPPPCAAWRSAAGRSCCWEELLLGGAVAGRSCCWEELLLGGAPPRCNSSSITAGMGYVLFKSVSHRGGCGGLELLKRRVPQRGGCGGSSAT
ncbi:unnamed protein product [Closterium sp. NIES-54]